MNIVTQTQSKRTQSKRTNNLYYDTYVYKYLQITDIKSAQLTQGLEKMT